MSVWTTDELDGIGNAEELRLTTRRPDGTLRKPVTIWVIRHGDDLYVRSYRGPGGAWYHHAREHREGRVQAAGVDKDVTFADANHGLEGRPDMRSPLRQGFLYCIDMPTDISFPG